MPLLHFFLSISFANSILIQSPTANTHDYFIYKHQSESQGLSDYFLQCGEKDELEELTKKAQFYFLNADIKKAKKHFRKIIGKKWNCEWNKNEREAIVYSFFRLAQLVENPSQKMQLLTEAIGFDDHITPNVTLTPPPILQLYKKIKKSLKPKNYLLPEFTKHFDQLYRNGVPLDTSSGFIKTYSLKARFTFSSDRFQIEKFLLEPQFLQKKQLEPYPLVSGDCSNHQLTTELFKPSDHVEVYFEKNCIKKIQKNSTSLKAHIPSFSEHILPVQPVKKKSWIRRNYLWVGAAALASIFIFNHLNNQDDPAPLIVPSNTYSPEAK